MAGNKWFGAWKYWCIDRTFMAKRELWLSEERMR